jgi:hypothetical protein
MNPYNFMKTMYHMVKKIAAYLFLITTEAAESR